MVGLVQCRVHAPPVRLESALEVVDLRRPMDDKANYLRAYCFFRFFFCRCTQ